MIIHKIAGQSYIEHVVSRAAPLRGGAGHPRSLQTDTHRLIITIAWRFNTPRLISSLNNAQEVTVNESNCAPFPLFT